MQSFVTNDKVYCEYLAESEDVLRKHAKLVGLPTDLISKVNHVCDPTTAQGSNFAGQDTKTPERENYLNS